MSTEFSSKAEQSVPPGYSEAQIKKLVEVIARSQHNHRDLIDNLDQAVFTLSLNGEVRVANRRLSEILGASFPNLIGHRLGEFVELPVSSEVEATLPSFLKKGSWTGTVPVRLKGKTDTRYFECWFQAVSDQGEVESVTGWARDVTQEHDSKRLFEEFFQSLREGVYCVTIDGRILDVNPAVVRMLKYDSKEEILARNFRDFYMDPAQADIAMQEIDRGAAAAPSSEPIPFPDQEVVLRRKDGTKLTCLRSGFAMKDRVNNTILLQGLLFDITERREIEDKLRREQEFVRRLVASFPDLIAVLDRDGRYAFVSQRINEFTGLRPEEIIGKPLGYRSNPEDRERLLGMFNEVMTGRSANSQLEFRSSHADGTWRTLRMSASPLFDESGTISGVVSSARDVTEAKQIEQQVAEKEKFAAMGQMMAGAAHELNNPLTAILGVSELLRERASDESSRRQLEIVLQQALRAAGIVQNLRAFARPPAQGRSRVNLDKIAEHSLQLQKSALDRKKIAFKLEAPAGLPQVEGDSRLLGQVFQNLIVNAEQAISSARDRGTITIALRRAGDDIEVVVADDGPGIPPESIGKVFDPFFTTKRPGGGTGLGLTICLAVVKEHGGSIDVESSPEAGAAFHIRLPIAHQEKGLPETRGAAPASASRNAAEQEDALRGHRVLVVDDEESIREIVEEGLRARGIHVDSVGNSEAALAYFTANACEVVLCDSNLPGLNGEQLFDRVRAQLGSAAPRFIFITGDLVDSGAVEKFREKGAYLVQKPFRVATLAALVADILQPQPSRAL